MTLRMSRPIDHWDVGLVVVCCSKELSEIGLEHMRGLYRPLFDFTCRFFSRELRYCNTSDFWAKFETILGM